MYELSGNNFEKRTTKTNNFTVIEIIAFKGRSYDAKKRLYSEIVKNLSLSPGIDCNDLLIVLNEQPLENWGIGGKPAAKEDLGFNINV